MDRTDLLLWLALQEDLGHGDVTTEAVVDPGRSGTGFCLWARAVRALGIEAVPEGVRPDRSCCGDYRPFQDGERIEANAPVFRLAGAMQALLTGERLALNLLQRLSGIATLTRQMVDAMSGTSCRLLDTRKTTPLWRALEKEAVRHGGGTNHRFGLYDGVLIKDNHIAAVGGVREAVQRARQRVSHTLKIEVEVENLQDLEIAIECRSGRDSPRQFLAGRPENGGCRDGRPLPAGSVRGRYPRAHPGDCRNRSGFHQLRRPDPLRPGH